MVNINVLVKHAPTRLLVRPGICVGAVLAMLLVDAVSAAELIDYEVVAHNRYSAGAYNGKDAYYRKERGSFDRESMQVVAYYNRPSDLPQPTVIASSPLPLVTEFRAGSVLSKADLKGEDAVFQRIFDDQEKEKCIWNPELCAPPSGIQQRRQFVLPKP